MIPFTEYLVPQSIPAALRALAAAPGPARVIAGGSDLLLDIEQGRHAPVHTLVDVSEIPELTAITETEGGLFVGAAAPLNRVTASPLVRRHAPALVEAAGLIGGPQLRNTATLGGNVAHALPAGDGTIALLALDAQAEAASGRGRRRLPLSELFLGPGKSTLAPDDLLVGFHLPARGPGEGSAFRRVMRPQGVAIAILNIAVWLKASGGRVLAARVACGPSGPVPRRIPPAEAALLGQPLEAALPAAAEALLGYAQFRTSKHRAGKAYRQAVAVPLLRDTALAAWSRTHEN